jgi:hypothetical protein
MASRLNHLFQTAPLQFLQRTVLFTDGLTSADSTQQMRHKIAHCIDLDPTGQHLQSRAKVLSSQHLYEDMPLIGYFVPPGGVALIPREDPPHRFVFLPEFTRCRLLITAHGECSLQLQLEENLAGVVPNSTCLDAIGYWDFTTGHLLGVIRATAILVKDPGQPWTFIMQQIVGTQGRELVRQSFSRPLQLRE